MSPVAGDDAPGARGAASGVEALGPPRAASSATMLAVRDAPTGSARQALAQALGALEAARDRDEVAQCLLRYARAVFGRGALFVVKTGMVAGWKGFGRGFNDQTLATLVVPLDGPSLFATVRQMAAVYAGGVPATEINQRFLRVVRKAPDDARVVLVPFWVRDRLVGVLYADGGEADALAPQRLAELHQLAYAGSRALEAAVLRRRVAPLPEALEALRAAADREHVADAVLGYAAATGFERAGLFAVKRDAVVGWRGRGDGLEGALLAEITVPLERPSFFREAIDAPEATVVRRLAGLAPTPADARFLAAAGRLSPPRDAIVVPLRVGDRAVCVLYADDLRGGPLDAARGADFARVADAASEALARLVTLARHRGHG